MAADHKETIFPHYDSESPIATELRRLYHNIRKSPDGRSYKSFLLTSATRGEGKSTIASHLALTIAQFPNTKVLVVDADLRRPRMHEIFGVELAGGVADCLGHGADPVTVIKKTRASNLDVITAGGTTDSPSKLFESQLLSEFFAKIRFYYEIVLVDSAPALAVSDTLFLCAEVEAVLFVVLAGSTPADLVVRARDALKDARANVIGAVVNNVSEVLPYYYDYKYYGTYSRK